ncbi:hypothetical protein EON63_10020 [archaeon]|nr:MAG: hypothetical protein EON63_10020 [archaeon]
MLVGGDGERGGVGADPRQGVRARPGQLPGNMWICLVYAVCMLYAISCKLYAYAVRTILCGILSSTLTSLPLTQVGWAALRIAAQRASPQHILVVVTGHYRRGSAAKSTPFVHTFLLLGICIVMCMCIVSVCA